MDIIELAQRIKKRDIVKVVKTAYQGYDEPLNSKVLQPDKYGVRLVEPAEKLVEDAFGATPCAPRRADKRRLQARVQCRMSKRRKGTLQVRFKRDGWPTVQIGMTALIDRYLDGGET